MIEERARNCRHKRGGRHLEKLLVVKQIQRLQTVLELETFTNAEDLEQCPIKIVRPFGSLRVLSNYFQSATSQTLLWVGLLQNSRAKRSPRRVAAAESSRARL